MDIEKFRPLLGELWFPYFKEFIASSKMDAIYSFLKAESSKGIKICPESGDVFNVFKEVNPKELKIVLIGQNPYHQLVKGVPIASGIAFDCRRTGKLQPSLQYFYDEVERKMYEEGMCIECMKNPDLSYLGRQGVMMMNADLTVQANKADSHLGIWEEFQKFFIQQVINAYFPGMIFILAGRQAQRLEKYIDTKRNYIFKCSHPASAAHRGDLQWNAGTMFQDVGKLIIDNYGHLERIFWLDSNLPF